jgi:putative membrane protein
MQSGVCHARCTPDFIRATLTHLSTTRIAMLNDALLAIAHHLAVFSLVAILFAEWTLLRPGISAAQLRFIGTVDMAYGAMAGLAILAGFARAIAGSKGWEFYAGNFVFWAKIAVFAIVGGLSSVPTAALLRWRRAGVPGDVELRRLRVWLNAQLVLVALIPVLAALMARGIGH